MIQLTVALLNVCELYSNFWEQCHSTFQIIDLWMLVSNNVFHTFLTRYKFSNVSKLMQILQHCPLSVLGVKTTRLLLAYSSENS